MGNCVLFVDPGKQMSPGSRGKNADILASMSLRFQWHHRGEKLIKIANCGEAGRIHTFVGLRVVVVLKTLTIRIT